MRNYVKLLASVWRGTGYAGPHPPNPQSTFYMYAFGAEEDDMLENIVRIEATYRALFPVDFHTDRQTPQVVWVLLDQLIVSTILNGPHLELANVFFAATDLPDPQGNRYPDIDWGKEGLDIIRVKSVGDESPRKDWSGGE